MSTMTAPPAGDRVEHTGGPGRSRLESVRILLRITLVEVRRSPFPLILPLVAALLWFDALRAGQGLPPIWTQRASILPNHVLPDLGPVTAGMAAWIGGREQRRGMADLVGSTARPRWLRQIAAWAAALAWTMVAYAACVAVIYILAARAGSWGGSPWWPVAFAGLGVALFCTFGFVAAAVFPGRFTAPLAALGTLFVSVMVYQDAVAADSGWTLLSPNNRVPPLGWGVFHPVPPDLPIVQSLFLLGAGCGPRLRKAAGAVTIAGLAACAVAFALATTATTGAYGHVVPVLHDAADDAPIPYTPVCTHGVAVPVCIHPAFSAELPAASAAFTPLLAEIAGLPGAPVRATQIDTQDLPASVKVQLGAGAVLDASAPGGPLLEYGFDDESAFTDPNASATLRTEAATLAVTSVIAPRGDPGPAQQAIEAALYQSAGVPRIGTSSDTGNRHNGHGAGIGVPGPVPGSAVDTAAARFAALPAADRHAWLTEHVSQLRSGQVTIEELP